MNLVLVGLSHRTAPVEIRELCAVAPADCAGVDEKLLRAPEVDEAVVLSTCNRTELLAVSSDADAAAEWLKHFLRHKLGDSRVEPENLYELRGEDAVEHLFGVAASLDSMVLGEAQILGQVKQAYRAAVSARSCGPVLNRLFHRAFRAAKRVRNETGLGAASISMARVGVQLAREIFESFDGKKVVLLGAGEMAETALQGLRQAGVRDVVIVNRTLQKALQLAEQLGARATAMDTLEAELVSADVALASVQVDRPILLADTLRRVTDQRRGQPLLIVDLGVPRNVAPEAGELSGLYLYDLDDLEEISERGRAKQQAAIAPARAIVADERDRFGRWRASLPMVPTVRRLRSHAEEIARSEVLRTLSRLQGGEREIEEELERMAEAIVAKLLHRPLEQLRAETEAGAGPYYTEAVWHLFGLEEDEE